MPKTKIQTAIVDPKDLEPDQELVYDVVVTCDGGWHRFLSRTAELVAFSIVGYYKGKVVYSCALNKDQRSWHDERRAWVRAAENAVAAAYGLPVFSISDNQFPDKSRKLVMLSKQLLDREPDVVLDLR